MACLTNEETFYYKYVQKDVETASICATCADWSYQNLVEDEPSCSLNLSKVIDGMRIQIDQIRSDLNKNNPTHNPTTLCPTNQSTNNPTRNPIIVVIVSVVLILCVLLLFAMNQLYSSRDIISNIGEKDTYLGLNKIYELQSETTNSTNK